MAEFPPIQQFQLIQRTSNRLEMLLVTPRPLSIAEEGHVRGWVLAAVGHPFDITLHYVAEIPRAAHGKYEDFRCEVAPASTKETFDA